MSKEELYTALEGIIGSEVNDNTDLSTLVSAPEGSTLLELLSDDVWFESLWNREEYLACCTTAYQLYDLTQAAEEDSLQLHLHALRLSLVNKPSFFYEAVTPLVYPELDVSCVDWPAVAAETAWNYKASNHLAVLLDNAGLLVPLHLYKSKTTVGDVYQALHEYTCTHPEAWQKAKELAPYSSFRIIRESNGIYVDKCELLKKFIRKGAFLFLARPRRFGKSVLLETLSCLYSGRSELFKGTAFEAKSKNMPACHVVRMSWASILTANTTNPELTLKSKLIKILVNSLTSGAGNDLAQAQFKEKHQKLLEDARSLSKQSEISDADFTDVVSLLLEDCYDSSRPYVLLIDEYDAPANAFLADSEQLKGIMSLYQQFFSLIKDYVSLFDLVFITGISKFREVGIFSGFNNLRDLSENLACRPLLGFTQQELYTGYFLHLVCVAQGLALRYLPLVKNEPSVLDQQALLKEWLACADLCSPLALLLSQLKRYYDGYSFYPERKNSLYQVYNPWSIVNFLKSHEEGQDQYSPDLKVFTNYWVESGSFVNSFFVHKMKFMSTKAYEVRRKLLGLLNDLLHDIPYNSGLDAVNQSPHLYTDGQCVEFGAAFLYRAGYLTWQDRDHLCIPNREVRSALESLFQGCIQDWLDLDGSNLALRAADVFAKTTAVVAIANNQEMPQLLNLDNLKRFFNGILQYCSSSYLSEVNENYIRDFILIALVNNKRLNPDSITVIPEESIAGGRADLVIKRASVTPIQIHSIEFKKVDALKDVAKADSEAAEQVHDHHYSEHHTTNGCQVFQYVAVFYNAAADTSKEKVGANQITCEVLRQVGYHEVVGEITNSSAESVDRANSVAAANSADAAGSES